MANFRYKAIDASGKSTTGTLVAPDRPVAMKTLEKRRLRPIYLKEDTVLSKSKKNTQKKPSIKEQNTRSSRQKTNKQNSAKNEGFLTKIFQKPVATPQAKITLTNKQILIFTAELSDMLEAGLQLEQALRAMENRQELGSLKEISTKIREQIRDGVSFSTALSTSSDSFSSLYCNLAAAGEVSGSLGPIMKRQVYYLQTIQKLQEKIILAMIYPSILILMAIGVTVLMMTVLLPQLTSLVGKKGELPVAIQFMNDLSNFISSYWWLIISVITGIIAFFLHWKKQPNNRPTWDRVKLKTPLLGDVILKRTLVQFLETMANLLHNGVPALQALELTQNATVNLHIKGLLREVYTQVADGRALSRSMLKTNHFPSDRYDREFDKAVQILMAVISPIVIFWIAVLVGSLLFLILTAMSDTLNNLN